MANYNKIILVGNMTRDPQLSYLPSQTPVVEFGLAVNRNWKSQDGQQREETCFVDVRAYGKQAEVINHYMSKGRAILVEGRLQFQQWQGQDGGRRSKHIVVAENFQFLGAAPSGAGEAGPSQVRKAKQDQAGGQAGPETHDDGAPAPTGDDIPF